MSSDIIQRNNLENISILFRVNSLFFLTEEVISEIGRILASSKNYVCLFFNLIFSDASGADRVHGTSCQFT